MKNSGRVPIVYYHSIGPKNKEWRKSFLTLDASLFEKQLIWLKKRYTSILLKEYWLVRQGLIQPVRNPLMITFDDGYLDNWIWAFPLLKKYGLKATIFVSPQFVDNRADYRPNLDDYYNGKATLEEITKWGFLSWVEMRIMEKSGLIDIQSHTMTHTKYYVSDELTGFHHPGSDSLYYIANLYPKIKPYYITDNSFEGMLPYGYPVFTSMSSILARRVEINQDFIDSCIESLRGYDFGSYSYREAFNIVKPIYIKYREGGSLIVKNESLHDYIERLKYEIIMSKIIIEENLNKKVEFLCWPFGDNNKTAHDIAIEAGFLMTTTGNFKTDIKNDPTRLPERIGVNLSTKYRVIKTGAKLKALSGAFPFTIVINLARKSF